MEYRRRITLHGRIRLALAEEARWITKAENTRSDQYCEVCYRCAIWCQERAQKAMRELELAGET